MRRPMLLLICCLMPVIAWAGAAASSPKPLPTPTPISSEAARLVRETIRAQLDAFAADDAEAAFAQAAPGIRRLFDSPARFIAMVKASYPVVYRPASVTFLQARSVEGEVVQGVRFTDATGGVWYALYRMERLADGPWRIAGCELVRGGGQAT